MILRAHAWPTNGHMIADVAKLGYLDGQVLDATYGLGTFWSEWCPDILYTNDLASEGTWFSYDFTDWPESWIAEPPYDAVVFDPPYKLNGTPDVEVDARYGTQTRTDWQDRMRLIAKGTRECARITKKHLLVKCQDQVCAGQVRWQTDLVTENAYEMGMRKVDRFDFLSSPRPQPAGRPQKHAAANYSTLLVFAK